MCAWAIPGRDASLDAVMIEGIRVAFAIPEDRVSPVSALVAVARLIELSPERPGSWFLAGFATLSRDARPLDLVPGEHRAQYVAGLLFGALDRGQDEWLAEVVASYGDVVRQVVADEVRPGLIAPVLQAVLAEEPGWACDLGSVAPSWFSEIAEVREAFRARAVACERAGDPETAERLRSVATRFEVPS